MDALQPTPFSGCKGESLVAANPSGFQVRGIPVSTAAQRIFSKHPMKQLLTPRLQSLSLGPSNADQNRLLQARNAAYRRTMLAGRAWWDAAWTRVKLESAELGTWLLCAVMYGAEACALSSWLASRDHAMYSKQPEKP